MYGADYLVRVKNPSGSFYRVIGAPGLGKKPEDRRIFPSMKGFRIKKKPIQETDVIINMNESNTEDALLYQVGYRAGGGMSIAALAIAARYNVSGDFSNEDYLNAAKDGFAYLEKQNIIFTNDGKENIVDDYCALIAATELYKTTKDHLYKKAADFRAKNLLNRISSDQMYKNYFLLLNFTQFIPQLIKINISNMFVHNNNILPKASHTKPASAHWSLTMLHFFSTLQCSHRKIKPEFTRTT